MAFTNYMNVLSDFIVRVEEQYPLSIENEELNALLTTIKNQESEIEMLNKELRAIKAANEAEAATETKAGEKPKKAAAKKLLQRRLRKLRKKRRSRLREQQKGRVTGKQLSCFFNFFSAKLYPDSSY